MSKVSDEPAITLSVLRRELAASQESLRSDFRRDLAATREGLRDELKNELAPIHTKLDYHDEVLAKLVELCEDNRRDIRYLLSASTNLQERMQRVENNMATKDMLLSWTDIVRDVSGDVRIQKEEQSHLTSGQKQHQDWISQLAKATHTRLQPSLD